MTATTPIDRIELNHRDGRRDRGVVAARTAQIRERAKALIAQATTLDRECDQFAEKIKMEMGNGRRTPVKPAT